MPDCAPAGPATNPGCSVRRNKQLWIAVAVLGAVLLAWFAFNVVLIGSTLPPEQRAALGEMLVARLPLVFVTWLLVLLPIAAGLRLLVRRYVKAPARLLEQVRVLLRAESARPLAPTEAPEYRELVQAINELAGERETLRREIAERVEQASRNVQQERNRLAALVSELSQSVVVCNLDGRIVLYNNRARLQFRALSQAPAVADGSELIGIGRSIYAVFDHQLVAHALDNIHQRMARGAASPATQFVTVTPSGQLLRVQMAPVRSGEAVAAAGRRDITGYVLMLENVTRSYDEQTRRDQALLGLADASRAALAGVQFALNQLDQAETLDVEERRRIRARLRGELGTLDGRLSALGRQVSEGLKTRWPLEDMLGADLLSVAQQRIAAHCRCPVSVVDSQGDLWVRVDSFLLLKALTYLAERVTEEFELRQLQLRLQPAGDRAHLDLIWTGRAMSTETVMTWKMDPMVLAGEVSPLTVRDVVERHGGDMWFERERARHQAFFRFQLPHVVSQDPLEAAEILAVESRPEFYDFDLFQSTDESRALEERPLASLAYTVFDTETTGLQPSAGDEIIQIGAVRIVNGKLLRQESFDQLVDPGRVIPAASIPIHGITQDMVSGKRRIHEVLPAFHAYARDTVLVAHNAAFDMRFLQLKEASTGVSFQQPVLDTLLLSALVHPNQDSHRLEAIAERFNITVLGRHTALGDAIVTAEVFLRFIPLLQAMGIHTLRQAREATQNTYLARLKY